MNKQKDKAADQCDVLLDCGFCDELNLFEGYWEPPAGGISP